MVDGGTGPGFNKQHYPEAEFLDEIQTSQVLRVSSLSFIVFSSFAWDFYLFKLTQPLTVSVKEKRGKPERKPYPYPFGLRNPYRNLKSENSEDYARNLNVIVGSWIRLLFSVSNFVKKTKFAYTEMHNLEFPSSEKQWLPQGLLSAESSFDSR